PAVKNFGAKEPDRLIGTENIPGSKNYFQLITQDPLYFDVRVPRPFKKATVSVTYQNPDQQTVMKLGVRQANGDYFFEDLAYEHPVLEGLGDHWVKIQDYDDILWQKNDKYLKKKREIAKTRDVELERVHDIYTFKNRAPTNEELAQQASAIRTIEDTFQEKLAQIVREGQENPWSPPYSSVDDFLSRLPDPETIAQYNYHLTPYLELPGYQKSSEQITVEKSIRGSHEIRTYIGPDEDSNFIFTVQDINRHPGEDLFAVNIYDTRGIKVYERTLEDDGETLASGRVLPERLLNILLEEIPFGTYRIEILAPDDIFIKRIATFQKLVMFKKNLYLAENVEYQPVLGDKSLAPTTVYTNVPTVTMRTSHENGLQIVRVRDEDVIMRDLHQGYSVSDLTGVTRIVSPKNDIVLRGNGYFAFSPSQLFDPDYGDIHELDGISDIDTFSYIIAHYPQATSVNGWNIASASVEVPYLYNNTANGKFVNFIIQLSGMPEQNKMLKVRSLSIVFEKDPITLNNAFSRFKNWTQSFF
ncbi:MAG: hypothetical protein V1685_02495, partial [Parcubacteria group bacterium]